MEGLLDEFYEDNGDRYIDDTEDLSTLRELGAQVRDI